MPLDARDLLALSRLLDAAMPLLRVFGQRRRSEWLFDALQARWRDAGPVQLIGAPDLAKRTIKVTDLFAFLGRRLRSRFDIEPRDLPHRLGEIDLHADQDARYRVNDVYCGAQAWQAAVQALMRNSERVAMDLRGFAQSNPGCLFELRALCDLMAWRRVVLIVDAGTDEAFLRVTLQAMAQDIDAASPHAGVGGTIRLLVAGASSGATVDSLVALAGQADHEDPAGAHRPQRRGEEAAWTA